MGHSSTCGGHATKKAKDFWELIYNEMKKMFQWATPKRPEAFLTGNIGMAFPKKMAKLFMYVTTAGRILHAQKWEEEEAPTKEE